MSKKIIVTIMLGMNRFTEKDADHPFDMSHLKKFNTIWLPQISSIEKTNSTPIYEMSKTIDEFINDYNYENKEINPLINEDILFIAGRGTIGDNSEEYLLEALLEARRQYGPNAFFLFYTKSFGVVDTLRTFKLLKKENSRINADLMFMIDGYATPISKNSVSKIYKKDKKRERRFIIEKNIKKVFCVVQRKRGFKGLRAGNFSDTRCYNHIITQSQVDKVKKYYDSYDDGYQRRLDVEHFNMEEIVSTIPCCKYRTQMYTVNELTKYYLNLYMKGKV